MVVDGKGSSSCLQLSILKTSSMGGARQNHRGKTPGKKEKKSRRATEELHSSKNNIRYRFNRLCGLPTNKKAILSIENRNSFSHRAYLSTFCLRKFVKIKAEQGSRSWSGNLIKYPKQRHNKFQLYGSRNEYRVNK